MAPPHHTLEHGWERIRALKWHPGWETQIKTVEGWIGDASPSSPLVGLGLGSPWIRNDASDMLLCRLSWSKLKLSMSTLQHLVPLPSNEQNLLGETPRALQILSEVKKPTSSSTFSSGILMTKTHQFPKSRWTYQTLHLNRSLHNNKILSTMQWLTLVLAQGVKNQIKSKLI